MKKTKKLISAMLALIMVIGLIPITSLTALATTKTDISALSFTFRNEDDIPAIGDPITYHFAGAISAVEDDLITLTGSGLNWHDEEEAVINDTFDDHGCYFEAGRTYYAEIIAKLNDTETYKFSENTNITITNSVT